MESMDTKTIPGFPPKYPVSAKHQLLIYLSLLETNKAYVMNALRMPALQVKSKVRIQLPIQLGRKLDRSLDL